MTRMSPTRRRTPTGDALNLVREERMAQDGKWGEQNWPDALSQCNYPSPGALAARAITDGRAQDGSLSYTDILLEEVAEAVDEARASALGVRGSKGRLKTELIQVAAVAVAWFEKLNREESLV
ncbi:hypothetical protein SEA_STEPHIG9_49 [Mycobacterium phage Stephig9]|uniref:Uncharacterized protein n=1 Tax=Mycobacterium phage Stephig9 TaxID=2591224 RepID=A0A514DHF1_9CAUD|nr:hypothetical protein SEA_STEPHIG9_49 [Mycobacterium phage Stephig9]